MGDQGKKFWSFIYADSGKNFQSLINVDRLPFSWGDVRNGKTGIPYTSEEIEEKNVFDKMSKHLLMPLMIPEFDQKRQGCLLSEK